MSQVLELGLCPLLLLLHPGYSQPALPKSPQQLNKANPAIIILPELRGCRH